MSATSLTAAPSRAKVAIAFAAVYLLWGSTYLAIRLSVATIPPFVMAGCRYLLAGGLLFAWLVFRGTPLPTRRQWKEAAITGTLLLLGGNGLVCWAEQTVASSTTALILTSSPIWFAVFDMLRPGGRRPQLNTVLGLVVGFSGTLLLVFGAPAHDSQASSFGGTLALVAACAFWAGGSLYNKYHTERSSPWMSTAAQMLCGGVSISLVALVRGDFFTLHPGEISRTSGLAFVYLVLFGSILGFSAYVWLLTHCAPAKVATYAYVNPIIATLLGWLLLKEPLTPLMCIAAAIVLSGVFVVQWPMRAPKAEGDEAT